jgi:anti-anti-sigma factor
MTCELEMVPVVVVRLAAEIDLTNREQVYDRLYAAFARGAAVVVADLTVTSFCDCGSLRRLLAVQHRAAAQGNQLRLVIPPGSPVRRVADLTELDGQLSIYSSVREATAWLPHPGGSLRVS